MAKEYFISKLSFKDDEKIIKDVFAYEFKDGALSAGQTYQRSWMVDQTLKGIKISLMTLDPNEPDNWIRGGAFTYVNGLYSWGKAIPKNLVRRKTFVSYYHRDDQQREKFQNLFGDLLVSKSVEDGDIDSENSDEYIKKLIQQDFLCDTTVLIVLIGPKTKCRMHVDWEIAGALDQKVGDCYSGLIGILLPTHADYGSDRYSYSNLPARLAANAKSGYAILRDWTENRVKLQEWIELATNRRNESEKIVNRSIPQMANYTCI